MLIATETCSQFDIHLDSSTLDCVSFVRKPLQEMRPAEAGRARSALWSRRRTARCFGRNGCGSICHKRWRPRLADYKQSRRKKRSPRYLSVLSRLASWLEPLWIATGPLSDTGTGGTACWWHAGSFALTPGHGRTSRTRCILLLVRGSIMMCCRETMSFRSGLNAGHFVTLRRLTPAQCRRVR